MSMNEELASFSQILNHLLDVNNDIRSAAEKEYEAVPSHVRVTFLLQICCSTDSPQESKELAIVLFRRILASDYENVSKNLPPDFMNSMKQQLLLLVQLPCDRTLKKKVCDAVSELARNLQDDEGNNTWPEFLQCLFGLVNSDDQLMKEAALNMFTYVPSIFGTGQATYLEVIKQMLITCLGSTQGIDVRVAAVKASTAFLLVNCDDKQVIRHLQDVVSPILAITGETATHDDDHCVTCLTNLIDLAERCPNLLRPSFDPMMVICLKMLKESALDDGIRHSSLEVIVAFSEAAASTVRKKGGQYLPELVQYLLHMMTQFEEDTEWDNNDEGEDDDQEAENIVAEVALDRLACAVGGKTIMPLVVTTVSTMLRDEKYQCRAAGLIAFSILGEGCEKQMTPILSDIVDGVTPFISDPHPRVRYACCNAIGQMSTDFAPSFEEKFHAIVLPKLFEALDDTHPRVQAHAGAAMVNFFNESPIKVLLPYMNAITERFHRLILMKIEELKVTGKKIVLEQLVVSLASLADTMQENFINYYDLFVPSLKYIIENVTSDEVKLLRGKSIEALTLIGLAVGKDKFCSDAQEVMNLLLRQQSGDKVLADDDPQLSYMISAWTRICKILGPSFSPYLQFVMPHVLRTASFKIEVSIMDKDEAKCMDNDSEWNCVNIGEQQAFGIRTTGMEEKATACQMIVCYARELKHEFVDYVEPVVTLFLPLLKFYFNDDIRSSAAESFPPLLKSAEARGSDYMVQMWNYFSGGLLQALESEPDKEVLVDMFSSLCECIEIMGKERIDPSILTEVVRILDGHLKDHFDRALARTEKRNDEDYDEGVEEILEDEDGEDEYILSKVSDLLHSCFLVFGADFLPFFDHLVGHFTKLGSPDRTWSEHQWAICVFDDVIEHTGAASNRYSNLFLPLITSGLQSTHPEIRQASAYGWGVMGLHGGPSYAQHCADSLPLLKGLIEANDSRSSDNINATENAISAVSKILQHNSSQIHLDSVIPTWVMWLPVFEDEEELPHTYGFLLFLLENNHPVILGDNNGNIPRILAILAETLARNAVDVHSPTGTRIVSFVKNLQSNGPLFEVAFQSLNPVQQEAIKQLHLLAN